MRIERIKVKVYWKRFRGQLFGLWLAVTVFPALSQETVYTYDAAGNSVAVTSTGGTSLTISIQPQTQLLESNAPVSFSVLATGPGISYQ
jgi:YD repeat-containing protein